MDDHPFFHSLAIQLNSFYEPPVQSLTLQGTVSPSVGLECLLVSNWNLRVFLWSFENHGWGEGAKEILKQSTGDTLYLSASRSTTGKASTS